MKRYFKFDKNLKKIVAQLSIMIIVAFFLFYGYKSSHHFYFIILLFFVLGCTYLVIYRLFFLNYIFTQDKFVFKSLFKTVEIKKDEIQDVFLISLKERKKYNIFDLDKNKLDQKMYLVISKQEKLEEDIYKFSFFSIANENRMILEYSSNMADFFSDLKPKLYVQNS